MKLNLVLTDLDGTLLEPDGTLLAEAREAVRRCVGAGVPVCPVTSKTPDEVATIYGRLGIESAAGFENGAGVRLCDGREELSPRAVPVGVLRDVLDELRRTSGVPIVSIQEVDDATLAALTQLPREALSLVRSRRATLPLIAPAEAEAVLHAALPADGTVRLVRGNRFLHLQGNHSKADVVPRIRELAGRPTDGVVACGDAPNDIELLAAGDMAVIVPGAQGPCPLLLRRFPAAIVAPHPHGRGWAASILHLLKGEAEP